MAALALDEYLAVLTSPLVATGVSIQATWSMYWMCIEVWAGLL